MSQVTEQSVRFQTALTSIKLIQASAVLDLTEDDFEFLTSNRVWIANDSSRARSCVEACFYGTLDFVAYPRFPAPVEFIADVIVFFFSSRRRHTRLQGDWSSDVCSSDLPCSLSRAPPMLNTIFVIGATVVTTLSTGAVSPAGLSAVGCGDVTTPDCGVHG